MIQTKTEYKENFTNIEVMGAEVLFNRAYAEYMGEDDIVTNEEFFVTGGFLNSTSDANGCLLMIDNYRFSHCKLLPSHQLHAFCYDEGEKEYVYEVTYNNGFFKLDN